MYTWSQLGVAPSIWKRKYILAGSASCSHGNDENDRENANIWIRNPKWIWKRKEMKTEQFENVSV